MKKEKRYIITYNGITKDKKYGEPMPDELFEKLKKEYYTKPPYSDVRDNFALLLDGGVMNTAITNYYVRDLMDKTRIYTAPWTMEDAWNHKPIMDYFYHKTLEKSDLFNKPSVLDNLIAAINIGGIGVVKVPSNYPLASIYEVLQRYNVNNNWYDMSCGWGARLTGALVKGVNYFGTDPNYLLTERLHQLKDDWQETTKLRSGVDIRTIGSEVFQEDWVNKMGLCFTSPPYFFLEDYRIGDQSWKEGVTYEEWLETFMRPTIQNVKKYLIDEGMFAINVKDFNTGLERFLLAQDTHRIALEEGFVHIETITLENISRPNESGQTDTDEGIMVFMKKGCEHLFVNRVPEQIDIFDLLGDDF